MAYLSLFALIVSIALITYKAYKRSKRSIISIIPGPSSRSFKLGNVGELMQNQAGLIDFRWQEMYGDVIRFKAPFGSDRLMITDPKALQYILQTSGYRWCKYISRREISRLTSGKGLLWADGDVHKRQRKVMLPGFGMPEAKNFLPLFFSCAEMMSSRWRDVISGSSEQCHVFNIPEWTSRATLEAIGQAAFDYRFGALDDDATELGQFYQNMMTNAFGAPSDAALIIMDLARYLPVSILEAIGNYAPFSRLVALRRVSQKADQVAKDLVAMKSKALLEGKENKDIMSLLVKANAGANPKGRLNEAEMLSQMRVLILAGHETTSNTISWALYEITRNPVLQSRLREEIHAAEQVLIARGDSEFTIKDLEGMEFLNAVIKEVLRYHPVAIHLFRESMEDDVLPLSKPITTTTGEVINELPLPKGTKIIGSMPAYNRNKEIFGEDAHTFNPERWLTPGHVKKGVSLGVYANLATFSAGIRSCIGWRFAVVELQAFLVTLIRNFEFSPTPALEKIRRESCLVMVPTVEGELDKGSQLPLKVSCVSRD